MQTPLTPSELIKAIEAEAAPRSLAINDLCKRAGLNRATWQRWKAGMTKAPGIDVFRALEALLVEIKAMPIPPTAEKPEAA